MKGYGKKIKNGCPCCAVGKTKNQGKAPKKRARRAAKREISDERKK